MASPFDTWLNTLVGPGFNLRGDMHGAVRGQAVSHTITYPGNVTTATLTGTVKASPDSTSELATFTIGTPSFASGVTTWAVSLSGSDTAALPADTDGDGQEVLIYDFLLQLSGGTPQRILGGLFYVSGFVTEAA